MYTPDEPVMLHDILPSTKWDIDNNPINPENFELDNNLDTLNKPSIDTLSEASVSIDISDPSTPSVSPDRLNNSPPGSPIRSRTPSHSRSPSAGPNGATYLPVFALAHFLAT